MPHILLSISLPGSTTASASASSPFGTKPGTLVLPYPRAKAKCPPDLASVASQPASPPILIILTRSPHARLIYTVGNERDADYVPLAKRCRVKKTPNKKGAKMAEPQALEIDKTSQDTITDPLPRKERKPQAADGGPAKLPSRGRQRGRGNFEELAEHPNEDADDSGRNGSK